MIKILGLGESRLSFKLSNPFPGAMLVSPPIHSLSWIFQGFVPSSYLVFLSGFPTLEASPLWSPFWLQLCMTYSFAWSPVFYYACRIRGISLILFIPPPIIWGMRWMIGNPTIPPSLEGQRTLFLLAEQCGYPLKCLRSCHSSTSLSLASFLPSLL